MTALPKRNSTAEWQALDRRHVHPFTDHGDLIKRGSRVITKAEGTYLWDSEGKKLLDAFAGLWCVNVGYGRKSIAEAAYQQAVQARRIYKMDAQGNRTYMTDAEIDAARLQARSTRDLACGG